MKYTHALWLIPLSAFCLALPLLIGGILAVVAPILGLCGVWLVFNAYRPSFERKHLSKAPEPPKADISDQQKIEKLASCENPYEKYESPEERSEEDLLEEIELTE